MNPTEIRRSLATFADGELDPDARAQMEAWLVDHPEGRVEVERWRALRRCTGRVLRSERVPAGLAGRIREHLDGGPPVRQVLGLRVRRVGGRGLALAAAVLLAVIFWPRGGGGPALMQAGRLVDYHLLSAVSQHADTLNARDGADWRIFEESPQAYLRVARNASFQCALPTLQPAGYVLLGATEYRADDPRRDPSVLHTYFKCIGESNLVSLFIIDRPIDLCGADVECHPAGQGRRAYRAAAKGRFTFVTWTEGEHTYVLCCGVATEPELVALADRMCLQVEPTCSGYKLVEPNAANAGP